MLTKIFGKCAYGKAGILFNANSLLNATIGTGKKSC